MLKDTAFQQQGNLCSGLLVATNMRRDHQLQRIISRDQSPAIDTFVKPIKVVMELEKSLTDLSLIKERDTCT